MKLNIKYELHNNIRIRRIRVGFRAQDINSNGYNGDRSIDRSIEDRTRSTNFRVPTSYRNKRPLAAGNNTSLVLPLLLQHR